MHGSYEFETRVVSRASPQAVYRLLADATSWKNWAGPLITHSEWEVEPDPTGGAGTRRLGRRGFMVREEITAADPPHRHSYRLLSGQPVRSYRADVLISGPRTSTADAGRVDLSDRTHPNRGSQIEWRGAVIPLIPGTGPLMRLLLGRMVKGFATRLATAAESD
jgi:uncharacterized protein YndB with AHSA1/START domain